MTFEDLYKTYALDIPWWYTWYDREVVFFLNKYGSIIGDSILDIGCWYSRLASFCIENKKKYVGIDIAKTPIEYNKTHFKSNFINFFHTSIQDFDWDHFFSCIIDIWCLHCISSDDHSSILSHYFDILLPGWYIFLRYFSSAIDEPIFYIDTVPIVGITETIINNFIIEYSLSTIYSEIDTISFDLAPRKSILLYKNIYAKSSPL